MAPPPPRMWIRVAPAKATAQRRHLGAVLRAPWQLPGQVRWRRLALLILLTRLTPAWLGATKEACARPRPRETPVARPLLRCLPGRLRPRKLALPRPQRYQRLSSLHYCPGATMTMIRRLAPERSPLAETGQAEGAHRRRGPPLSSVMR